MPCIVGLPNSFIRSQLPWRPACRRTARELSGALVRLLKAFDAQGKRTGGVA